MNVTLKESLQTFAALIWIITCIITPGLAVLFLFYIILLTDYYWYGLLYAVYLYLDKDTPDNGGRSIPAVRDVSAWHYLADYFPIRAVKTCDIPGDRNYLFCLFPHGFLSVNSIVHFGSRKSNFHELFPGLDTYVATLKLNFQFPFLRDLLLAIGFITASKGSLLKILKSNEKGKAIGLVVGGAQESLHARPGSTSIFLKNRKGFVKVAMEAGASIVPVFSFGSNEIYTQIPNPPGSLVYFLQTTTMRILGLCPIIPIGRGFFQNKFGLIPRQTPINTVVGEPIDLPLDPNPSNETIDKYHKLFVEKLTALFEKHKCQYIQDAENKHLNFI